MGMTEQSLLERAQKRNDFFKLVATTAGAYSTGQIVGGLITIDSINAVPGPIEEQQLSVKLNGIALIDAANQAIDADIFFFNQKPVTTMTDKATFAPTVPDLKNCIGVLSVAGADYVAGGASGKIAAGKNQCNLGKIMKPVGGTAIYCVIVTRGAPTYGANGLSARFQFDA